MKLTTQQLSAATLAGSLTAVALAGPLNPPPGPVAPTMKTLTEVEPRIAINPTNTPGMAANQLKIIQPGSYYLPANLDGVALVVAADDVTVDLNGFRVNGAAIVSGGAYNRITVRNGTVTNATGVGVNFWSSSDCVFDDLRVANSTQDGFDTGKRATLRRCKAVGCGLDGFHAREATVLESCSAALCTDHGFSGDIGVRCVSCDASRNTSDGFYNLAAERCTSTYNTQDGFSACGSASGCRAERNSGDGFSGVSHAVECEAAFNSGIGFVVGTDGVMERCRAHYNTHQGIHVVGTEAALKSCFADSNGVNTQAGIWISGTWCHVEDCRSTHNGWGMYLDVGATNGMFVHNTCGANAAGNYNTIPAGANFAPIVTNPGFNSFSTATPLSNFSH